MDEIDLVVVGHFRSDGSATGTGFAKQSPGLRLEVVLIPMRDPKLADVEKEVSARREGSQ